MFSFDSPQEYSADFVMATLATTTSGDTTTADYQCRTSATAPTTTTTRPSISDNRPPVSVSKHQLSTEHSDAVATPPPAISIAETPNKEGNSVSSLQERTVADNEISACHNNESVSNSRPMEGNSKQQFIAHSHDRETDNLLDSLFDDIINDDIADNVYGFSHQHTNTGNNPISWRWDIMCDIQ